MIRPGDRVFSLLDTAGEYGDDDYVEFRFTEDDEPMLPTGFVIGVVGNTAYVFYVDTGNIIAESVSDLRRSRYHGLSERFRRVFSWLLRS